MGVVRQPVRRLWRRHGRGDIVNLPELCIKRPVFTTMLVSLPVVVGLMAYLNMGVDLFPNVDMPIVSIVTTRAGASVEEMETGVTKLIEEAVNTVSGIDELRSTTKEGMSVVTVIFLLEKNRDVAQQEVQSKVNTILSRLPTGTDTPIIDKFDIDAAPVMTIAVSGKRSLREVTEIADKRVKDSLSSLPGVGSVVVVGGRKRAVNVWVDTQRLEAYHLSIEQVARALRSQNLELPGGRVDQSSRELVLRTMGRIEDTRRFGEVIIANIGGQPIRVGDVARVEDSFEEPRSLGRLDGDNAVLLIVQKQSGSNTVRVIETVKRRLQLLGVGFAEEGLGDLRMEVIRDQSRFINSSMHEVKKHLVLGALLVAGTILLFLRDWRTMVIAALSIPTSIVASFMVMQWLGFTINNLTMLALVLAIGIVIDDAVVILENIFRWMEEKQMGAWDAALGATQEIAFAVMATTLSLVVIFLPIAFMSGRVGRFFYSFGVTSAVTILMSLLVAFTITPMLCSRFLKLSRKAKAAGAAHHSGGVYGHLIERPYMWSLRWSMRHRWAIILATIVVTASIFPLPVGRWISRGNPELAGRLSFLNFPGLLGMVGLDFIPKEDQSEIEIAMTTPEGWSLDRVDQLCREIEGRIGRWPEVVNVMTTIGDTSGRVSKGQGNVTGASIYVRLIELEKRERDKKTGRRFSQFEVMDRARAMMADYPDLRVSIQIPAVMSASGMANADIEFTLVGPSLDLLTEYSGRMIDRLRQTDGLADVDTTIALRKPELRVVPDRERCSDAGVTVESVAATLNTLVGGQIVSDYKDRQVGELYDVWLRARGIDRNDRKGIANLTLPSGKGGLVKLGSVADLVESRGPSQIDRYNRQRKITIICNLAGMVTSQAMEAFEKAFSEQNPGAEYQLIASGKAKTQGESNEAFVRAFAFSLLAMYMILASQFESFVHPITILLAVPLTIPFALLSLIFLGQPLTIFSTLGVFLLFGIVKKNGILQVDYTNVLRERAAADAGEAPVMFRESESGGGARPGSWVRWMRGLPEGKRIRLWAILEANRTRLRPILMTTLMLIAGMVPIAMGEGPGSAPRASMAKVIVGGQAMSLLLSLLVTPVAYSLFDDLGRKGRTRAAALKTGGRVEEPAEARA